MNHEYDINITIFDADDHVIYPSENILTKTTFGKQFDVIDISVRQKDIFFKQNCTAVNFLVCLKVNGLWARVKAVAVGVGKIKARRKDYLSNFLTPPLWRKID